MGIIAITVVFSVGDKAEVQTLDDQVGNRTFTSADALLCAKETIMAELEAPETAEFLWEPLSYLDFEDGFEGGWMIDGFVGVQETSGATEHSFSCLTYEPTDTERPCGETECQITR